MQVYDRLVKMATTNMHMAIARPSVFSFREVSKSSVAVFSSNVREGSFAKLKSSCHVSSLQLLSQNVKSKPLRFGRMITKAMADSSDTKPLPGLPVDLRGCGYMLFVDNFFCT